MNRAGNSLALSGAAILGATLFAMSAAAQTATVQQFMDRVDRIPDNATAALYPDTWRLKRLYEQSLTTVVTEQFQAQRAGRTASTCIPSRFTVDDDDARAFFNAMPAQRRASLGVTEGVRVWMRARFPCPA